MAVRVWVPTERLDLVKQEPEPIKPSLLDVHWICELSEPSSASVALAWNVTESPSVNSEPDDGDDMDTVGGEFGNSFIVIATCFESDAPSESITVAVMVWVPTERLELVNDEPVPIEPSLLDVH